MDVFKIHQSIMDDYKSFIESFIHITDTQIAKKVTHELESGKLWPPPLIQFNPSFEVVAQTNDLITEGTLCSAMGQVFQKYQLYKHQVEALRLGSQNKDFIVTSGTGSGKSLTYIGTIFNHILNAKPVDVQGIQAVIVYPMNALINSQTEELGKFRDAYETALQSPFPVTYAQYTGQEKKNIRDKIKIEPPHILLTNYMMLELILTRIGERSIRDSIYESMKYLVFDELHTYRGRQGADVGLLIRRIQANCKHHLTCIGTSATMISGGTIHQQKHSVASVASKIFGRPFSTQQIIQESLTQCFEFSGDLPSQKTLANAIGNPVDPTATKDELMIHPTAIWLENRIALASKEGMLIRNKPLRFKEIAHKLSEDSGVDAVNCENHLHDVMMWVAAVNLALDDPRDTSLPFRLHQFISQTGSVYTTLHQNEDRQITLEPSPYSLQQDDASPFYPNVFSRVSGQPFICVHLNSDESLIEPREFRIYGDDEDDRDIDGYIIVGDDVWNPETDLEELPDAWLRFDKHGNITKVQKKYEHRMPRKIYYDANGVFSQSPGPEYEAWYMPAPLLFDPTGGMFYHTKTAEGTKLARLGSEGRSSSTTVLSLGILKHLARAGINPEDQKLLSFTDNRQDAALQSGHFNDFIDVVRIRSAIYHALKHSDTGTLNYQNLGKAIFDALKLPVLEYANTDEEPAEWAVADYQKSLQDYLIYRAIFDLKRSWRFNVPNLDQCALLHIDYQYLNEASQSDNHWKSVEIMATLSPEQRRDLIFNTLEYFRQSYAIHSDEYLLPARIKEREKAIQENLKYPWKFAPNDSIDEPNVMRLAPLTSRSGFYSSSIGPNSRLGQYIRKTLSQLDGVGQFKAAEYTAFMEQFLPKLEAAKLLISKPSRDRNENDVRVYQLRFTTLIWKLGDETTVIPDVVRLRSYRKQLKPVPNEYFKTLYKTDFGKAEKVFHGEEHTGQLQNDDRRVREEMFREGKISALFCSPTMELGIDIRNLNVVHMRNAPPNPANYAQRSGRAGRGGQGALSFTYCGSYSSHDRHFFNEQAELVAGVVKPPMLDLNNEDLVLAHLHAVTMAEIGLESMNSGIGEMVDLDKTGYPLKSAVIEKFKLSNTIKAAIIDTFKRVIDDLKTDITAPIPVWMNDQWIDRNVDDTQHCFDRAIDRWRSLYLATETLLHRANEVILSGRYTTSSKEHKQADREMKQATRQRDLLKNQGSKTQFSEFYPFRYFASEGFLPGYNFTRLPVRTFVQVGNGGEYISRPRSIALREFGPQNILYHKGIKYKMNQMMVQDVENKLDKLKICKSSGYLLRGDQYSEDQCPLTGVSLQGDDKRDVITDVIEMTDTQCVETNRISCEEEERLKRGYQIETYFSVDGDMDRLTRAFLKYGEETLFNLTFIPAARIYMLNRGWRGQSEEGFHMGTATGFWYRQGDANRVNDERETLRAVKLLTWSSNDALYLEPMKSLNLNKAGVITLEYALKRAMEKVFHVEQSEIAVSPMGGESVPNIFFHEAAEGSLGILSRFVMETDIYHQIIDEAVSVCRYDEPDYEDKASYDDLLSYYNQRHHQDIDRFLIQDALEMMKSARVEIQTNSGFHSYDQHYQALIARYDSTSSTERKFLDYLYANKLRLPDDAQREVPGIYVRPDFYYEDRIWIFCDGTPHDQPDVQARDRSQRNAIRNRGDDIIVYYYQDDLAEWVARRPDVFKKVKE